MFIKSLKGSLYFSILDLRKSLIILKKGTAMKSNSTFSFSMQKQIQKSHITFDSEINRAFNELKFKSLLSRSGIVKQKGYSTVSILLLIVLLPFLKKTLSDFRNTNYIQNGLDAQKDSYYRFLNNERFNWRKLIYFVALKIITSCENVPLSEEVLIADDTIAPQTGKNMEFVSYHFDHKVHRSILGNQCLQLGYHNGINFFPIDVVFNTSSKRPNNNCRWAIEVFFKDAKLMLYLGKEQSKTFDAVVASYSIVMLRYLLLVYIISKRRIIGPVGPLFRQISEKQLFLHMAEKMWAYVKELIVRSSHILCYKIEPDIVLQLLDIVEDSLFNSGNLGTAKL